MRIGIFVGWGELVLKWLERFEQGLDIDFPDTGYKWDQLGQLAQDFHQQYQDWSMQQLFEQWQRVVSRILARVEVMDNQQLYGETWYKQWTMGRMIQLNTSSPMKSTRTKVRRFLREQL